MKQLTDEDLAKMVGNDFSPDDVATKRRVRTELKLSQLIPEPLQPAPKYVRLDLHQKTEQAAWDEINTLVRSGTRDAQIITGASGILKVKFQDWVKNSTIAPYIVSCKPVNNGCFEIKIRKQK